MIVYVDGDGVCIDLASEWLRWYNIDWEDNLKKEDVHSWDIDRYVKPECGTQIYKYLENPNIYDYAEAIPFAVKGVNRIRELGHRVVFATTTPRETPYRKFDKLQELGFNPEINSYLEIQDKSLLRGDILIDDNINNVKTFCGRGYLFRQPHNLIHTWTNTANDWNDVIRIMEELTRA